MKKTLLCAFAVLFTAAMTGCEDSSDNGEPVSGSHDAHGDHDHGDHGEPASFGEAFAQLEEMRDVIGSTDHDAAHEQLHHVGDVIKALSKFTEESELGAEAKETITANLKTAKEGFDAYDAHMHDAEGGKEWSEVADSVNGAIEAIEEAAGDLAAHAHGDHDDHDDHGDHGDGDHDEHADHEDGDHKDGDGDHKDGDAEHKDGEAAEGEKEE